MMHIFTKGHVMLQELYTKETEILRPFCFLQFYFVYHLGWAVPPVLCTGIERKEEAEDQGNIVRFTITEPACIYSDRGGT